jgi:hypothetical protein
MNIGKWVRCLEQFGTYRTGAYPYINNIDKDYTVEQ